MEIPEQVLLPAHAGPDATGTLLSLPSDSTALSLSSLQSFPPKGFASAGIPDAEPDGLPRRLPVHLEQLPVELDICVPLRGFSMRQMLALKPGTVLETAWSSSEDLPLSCRGEQFLWIEFEVVEEKLTARITRLA